MVGTGHLGQVDDVVLGSHVIIPALEIHVAEDDVDGDEQLAGHKERLVGEGVAEVRHGQTAVLLKIGGQTVDDLAQREFRILIVVDLRDLRQRLGVERHTAIDAGQLHVGPGADGLDGSILIAGDVGGTGAERGVAMGDVVVAVVDDTIVDVGRVVAVGRGGREVGQLAQVDVGVVCGVYELTPHLALEDVMVGELLHGLHDAEGIVDRVGLLRQLRVEDLSGAVTLEHVLA